MRITSIEEQFLNVETGEVKVSGAGFYLKASSLGSCVAVVAYDTRKKIGGLAHVMLPGVCPAGRGGQPTRYARNAIDFLLVLLYARGVKKNAIRICLVGAANVLRKADDTICEANMQSVIECLVSEGLPIVAKSLGGFRRRSVLFDVDSGRVYTTAGDDPSELFFDFFRK